MKDKALDALFFLLNNKDQVKKIFFIVSVVVVVGLFVLGAHLALELPDVLANSIVGE